MTPAALTRFDADTAAAAAAMVSVTGCPGRRARLCLARESWGEGSAASNRRRRRRPAPAHARSPLGHRARSHSRLPERGGLPANAARPAAATTDRPRGSERGEPMGSPHPPSPSAGSGPSRRWAWRDRLWVFMDDPHSSCSVSLAPPRRSACWRRDVAREQAPAPWKLRQPAGRVKSYGAPYHAPGRCWPHCGQRLARQWQHAPGAPAGVAAQPRVTEQARPLGRSGRSLPTRPPEQARPPALGRCTHLVATTPRIVLPPRCRSLTRSRWLYWLSSSCPP